MARDGDCKSCGRPTVCGCPECDESYCPMHMRMLRMPAGPPRCYLCANLLEASNDKRDVERLREAVQYWMNRALEVEMAGKWPDFGGLRDILARYGHELPDDEIPY